jgi:AmmeMemoRadiSam system protein A
VQELSPEARKKLLEIARRSVEAAVKGELTPEIPPEAKEGELAEPRGCFVTLKTHGRLRGCLGHFEADMPVAERVRGMARASALEDPRFFSRRLKPEELGDLEIEISVLHPREEVEDPLSIELGRHGIQVTRGGRSGCYLPQVATELGWTKEEFLSSCCSQKAGLAPDAWKDPETQVFRFSAEVFGEKD